MTTITINEIVYYVHPKYKLYAASEHGDIVNIIEQKPLKFSNLSSGHSCFEMKKDDESDFIYHRINEFVWVCFNGIIPKEKVIKHQLMITLKTIALKNLNLITYKKMIQIKRQIMKKLKPQIKKLEAEMKPIQIHMEKLEAEMEKLDDEIEPLETQMEKLKHEIELLKTMKC